MEEKLKPDDRILVALEDTPEKNNLKVVKGIDKKGKLQTADPERAKQGDFLNIDKGADLLENFFRNFLKQADDPKRMGVSRNLHKFYVITYSMLKDAVNMTAEQLEKFRVKPEDYIKEKNETEQKVEPDKQSTQETKDTGLKNEQDDNHLKEEQIMEQKQEKNEQRQEFKQFDMSRIPQSEYEKLGIAPESLEKYTNQMSWGFKTSGLVDLKPKVGDMEISAKARLSVGEEPDGSLSFKTSLFQEKVDVKAPVQGIILPEDVQKNLLETGHGGRVVDLELEPGKIVPALLSIDKITNRIEAVPVESLSFKKILGVELTPEQESALKRGEKVPIEGMTSKRTGELFNDRVQFNAAKGQLDFSGDGRKNRQEQNQTQQQGELKARKVDEVWVRPIQGGVALSKEQFNQVCKGEAVWIEGLERKPKQATQEGPKQTEATDKKGHKYNAWVWIDPEKGHVRHTGKHPDELKNAQGKEIKPAAGYETQVAVNSQGKTNEATKHSSESLKKGQTQPTEKQAEKQQEKKAVKKNKGISM